MVDVRAPIDDQYPDDEDMIVEIDVPEIQAPNRIVYTGTSHDAMVDDLARSGLDSTDIHAALCGLPEITACKMKQFRGGPQGAPGYVIPYYNIAGKRVPFYRVRTFNPNPEAPKYLQPSGTGSYVYFPPAFARAVDMLDHDALPRTKINGFRPSLIMVEGEKKAAKTLQEGFLCAGLGGVYNWKSRALLLPEATEITALKDRKQFKVKLPANQDGYDFVGATQTKWALGMENIIRMVMSRDMNIVICFDTDNPPNPKVQVAAAQFAFALRNAGISITRIRQLKLPLLAGTEKTGIDDFLVQEGADGLEDVLHRTLSRRTAFPAHPAMREYVNAAMGRLKSRSDAKDLSVAIIADMDTNGARMRDANSGIPYYFDQQHKQLMKVSLMRNNTEPLHETEFGQYLFRQYDLSQADTRVLPWIASHFTGEMPIYKVAPKSVIASTEGGQIAYQLGNSCFAMVSPAANKSIRIMDNGSNGLLFRSDQMDPPDLDKLKYEITRQIKEPLKPWWLDVLKEFKFRRESDLILASMLFYVSPWFLRWKGTQLPVELMIGEPGSGKSSMYMLRAAILTGRATLRNQPNDMRDWYASITSQDGLHITDNVKFANADIRQRISDEICRIVTEPDPFVEMRRLYTTSDSVRIPVRSIFAFTAIMQPFTNADILQRAAIFDLKAVGGDHISTWVQDKLNERGGREAWIAHHLITVHRMLNLMVDQGKWDYKYRSKHRLVNYEQLLGFAGSIFGIATPQEMTTEYIRPAEEQVAEGDWVIEGLSEFAEEYRTQHINAKWAFSLADVAMWAEDNDNYRDNEIITNARKLSRYIKAHETLCINIVGLVEVGKRDNAMHYRIDYTKRSASAHKETTN